MTFFFRGYDYSRVVIVYFWLSSIAVVWFSRAVFREALRVARRRGYNLRYAVVVGNGDLAAMVVGRIQSRPDVGIQVLGVVGDRQGEPRKRRGWAATRTCVPCSTPARWITWCWH
jgi:FlaA1/EpsC-like NDP-sugar epimerase